MIARDFLARFAKEERKRFRGLSPEVEQMLMAYPWPGNVRQLQNVIRNIVVLHDGDAVTREMIPPPVNRPSAGELRPLPAVAAPLPPAMAEPLQPASAPETTSIMAVETMPEIQQPILYTPPRVVSAHGVYPELEIIPLAEMERRMVLAALVRTDNDVPRAAALLEVNPSTVYRKVSQWRKDGLIRA